MVSKEKQKKGRDFFTGLTPYKLVRGKAPDMPWRKILIGMAIQHWKHQNKDRIGTVGARVWLAVFEGAKADGQ